MNGAGPQRLRKRGDVVPQPQHFSSEPFGEHGSGFPDPLQDLSNGVLEEPPVQHFHAAPAASLYGARAPSPPASASTFQVFSTGPPPSHVNYHSPHSSPTEQSARFQQPSHFQPSQQPAYSGSTYSAFPEPSFPSHISPQLQQQQPLPPQNEVYNTSSESPSPSPVSGSGFDNFGAMSRSRRTTYQSIAGPSMYDSSATSSSFSSSASSSGGMSDLGGENKYARKSYVPRWLRQLSPKTILIVIGILAAITLLGFAIYALAFGRGSSNSSGSSTFVVNNDNSNDIPASLSYDRVQPQVDSPTQDNVISSINNQQQQQQHQQHTQPYQAPKDQHRDAVAAAKRQAFEEKQRQKEVERERERQQAEIARQREQEALREARRKRGEQDRIQQPEPLQDNIKDSNANELTDAHRRRIANKQNQDQKGPRIDHYDQDNLPAKTGGVGVESPPNGLWQVRDGYYVNHGGDFGAPMTNLDDCRAACEKTEECRAITMYKKMGHCSMKSHTRISTHSDWYSELKDMQVSPWIVSPDSYISGGDDVTSIAYYTLPECRAACLKFPTCVAITQNENSNECFLKAKAEIFPHQSWHTEVLKKHEHLIQK